MGVMSLVEQEIGEPKAGGVNIGTPFFRVLRFYGDGAITHVDFATKEKAEFYIETISSLKYIWRVELLEYEIIEYFRVTRILQDPDYED